MNSIIRITRMMLKLMCSIASKMEVESCLASALQEHDPYIKGFWYAKFLQKVSETRSGNEGKLNE